MSESKATITSVKNKDSGFTVTFPDGINGEPDITMNGLAINCNGESVIYGSILACANYLQSHCEYLKSQPQVEYDIEHLLDDGVLNAHFKGGVSTKL